MRAAIGGDLAGSRFERSTWRGDYPDVRCLDDAGVATAGEGGHVAAAFELFAAACHVTDDTILTVAVMDWLLNRGDLRAVLRSYFRRSVRPELFGRVFRAWAEQDGDEPCGSFGNGAAMRVSPVAFAADDVEEVLRLARESALATHTALDAVAGAEAVALGVVLARTGNDKAAIRAAVEARFGYDLGRPLDDIRRDYRFSSACADTLPVAFGAFFESSNYEETLRRAISVGGDTDTTACMAGALAGAHWGLQRSDAVLILDRMPADLRDTLLLFERRFPESVRYAD